MVSRNLTEVYVLMRNNAIHGRQFFSEQTDERVHLMQAGPSHDLEGGLEMRGDAQLPPPWMDTLEEAHYIISRIRSKLSELEASHARQVTRPALDDSAERARAERLAGELARHFTAAHRNCAAIRQHATHGTKTEQKLVSNVVLALVTTLQELSITFRSSQSNYLKSLTSREERSKAFFDLPNFEELNLNDNSDLLPGLTNHQTDLLFSLPSTSKIQQNYDENVDEMFERPAMSQTQMMLIQEENTRSVAEREAEVNKIVRSILDLNDIFKDVAHLVHEQGTVLDRIDYNIEQTQVQVQEGLKQLQKAERYQKKNRKMHCILVLAVMIIVLVILLIIVKS